MPIYGTGSTRVSQELIDSLTQPSFTTRALDTGLNVLSTVGKILDTPGSVVRGLLSQTPERAFTGILDTDKRISGKELFGTKSTIGGIGSEILLDPLTYISFGTLTGAGKLAQSASKLTTAEKVLSASKLGNANRRLIDVYKNIAKTTSKQLELGREPLELLGETLGKQAELEQRSLLALDIPFTGINVPLVQGAGTLDRLGKVGSVITSVPIIDKLLNKFSTDRNFDAITKGINNEFKIGDREAEITASLTQKEFKNSINQIAKASGRPVNEIEQELIKLIENPIRDIEQIGLENLNKYFRQQERLSNLPSQELLPLAKKFQQTYDDLLKTEQQFGLPTSKLDNALGYSPRYLTPEARLYLKDSDSTIRKIAKLLKTDVPGFTKQRRLFGDKELAEANKLIKDKLKVDFDFFSSDIATNTAFRILQSKKAINDANTRLLSIKLLGKNRDALTKGDRKDLARLLRSKSGKPLLNKITVDGLQPIWNKYNLRIVVDDDNNILLKSTDEGAADAAKWLKIVREIRKDERFAKDQFKLGATPNVEKLAELSKKYGVDERDLDELVRRLNITNDIYHGTSTAKLEKIIGSGKLIAKSAKPTWKSTQFIKGKPAVYFSPDAGTAQSFAGDAATRYPGAQEHETHKTFKDYVLENFDFKKYGLSDIEVQKFKDSAINDSLSLKAQISENFKNVIVDIIKSPYTDATDIFNKLTAKFPDSLSYNTKQQIIYSLQKFAKNPDIPFTDRFNEISKLFGFDERYFNAYTDYDKILKSNKSAVLKTKLSDLLLFNKLHPEVREAILEKNFKFNEAKLSKNDLYNLFREHLPKHVVLSNDELLKIKENLPDLMDKTNVIEVVEDKVASIIKDSKTANSVINTILKFDKPNDPLIPLGKYKVSDLYGHDDLNNLPQIMTKDIETQLVNTINDPEQILNRYLPFAYRFYKEQYNIVDILKQSETLKDFEDYVDNVIGKDDAYYSAIKEAGKQYFSIPKLKSNIKNLGRELIEFKEKVVSLEPKKAKGYIRKTLDDAGLKNRFVSKADYDNVTRILNLNNEYGFVKDYTKTLDNVNAIYKTFLTQLFPAYHTRNLMGNVFVNMMAGVYNPKYYARAFKELAFKQLPPDELIYLKSIGVLGQGQHEEIYRLINESEVGKSKIIQSKIFQPARQVGFFVDDSARLAHYYSKKAEGLSDSEAAESVIKYLFDYSDLTQFEKQVMRRTMLFYTFLRKNIPLMLRQLWENPKFVQGYNRLVGNTGNSELPSWFNETIATEDNQYQLGLPIEDLSRFDTEGQGFGKLARMLLSLMTPAVTVPVEFTTGTSLYTGQAQRGNAVERLLQQSPLARFATTYNRFNEDANVPDELLRLLTGIKKTNYTDEEIKRFKNIEVLKNALESEASKGKANKVTIYGKNAESDERLTELNKILTSQYK